PSQYLEAGASYAAGKLTVTVAPLNTFTGPPCPVELSVRVDGAPVEKDKKAPKAGNFNEIVKRQGPPKKLVSILPESGTPRTGTVFLAADNFPRAFIFPAEFVNRATATAFDPLKDPGLRVVGGTTTGKTFRLVSQPVAKFPLRLET